MTYVTFTCLHKKQISVGYMYVLFQKMRLTSSSTRPSVLISTHPSISFPNKIQSGGLVNLIYLLLSN